MITIYVDKFRGFRNLTIPLHNVNFLVGENSTGKSSILALVHMLFSTEFWWSQNFNLKEYEFGGFSDLLSAGCKHNEEFSFGISMPLNEIIIPMKKEKENEKEICTYLVSWKEDNGQPIMSYCSQLKGKSLIAVKI
jgi:predicted ATPase